jgi:hypothetical protein
MSAERAADDRGAAKPPSGRKAASWSALRYRTAIWRGGLSIHRPPVQAPAASAAGAGPPAPFSMRVKRL